MKDQSPVDTEAHVLLTAAPSPFGHKVQVAAALVGLELSLHSVNSLEAGSLLRRHNPLGKLPVLITPRIGALFDSAVIIDYLHSWNPQVRLLPDEPWSRLETLRQQAIGDGLADAAILIYAECQWRPRSAMHPGWLAHQAGKIARTMVHITVNGRQTHFSPNAGHISIACSLHYLRMRLGAKSVEKWRDAFAWLDEAGRRCPPLQPLAPHPEQLADHLPCLPVGTISELLAQAAVDCA